MSPADLLTEFIKGLSQKLQNYFSLKTLDNLKEILRKNKIGVLHILTYFSLPAVFEKISDDDKKDIFGEDATDRVDYAIKSLEDLLCITKGKSCNIKIGYVQNLVQLESTFQTNKKK
ncbi:hypothetical protein C1646_774183 [Rhizophagus diaphanus]|nr:hypothetical protein C1646_774183 [Rhizophagus diaphanus] [Rhizophagus sp. MUCL 43196]